MKTRRSPLPQVHLNGLDELVQRAISSEPGDSSQSLSLARRHERVISGLNLERVQQRQRRRGAAEHWFRTCGALH